MLLNGKKYVCNVSSASERGRHCLVPLSPALEYCTPSQSDPLSVCELRAVSQHLTQWEEVGERLGVPSEVITQIRQLSR